MPRQKQIKITNGELEGYCLESSLAAWERNGWTRADDGSSEEAQVTEKPIETQVVATESEPKAPTKTTKEPDRG